MTFDYYALFKGCTELVSDTNNPKNVHDNLANQFICTESVDEFSHVELSLRMKKVETIAIVGCIKESGGKLQSSIMEQKYQNQQNLNNLTERSVNL